MKKLLKVSKQQTPVCSSVNRDQKLFCIYVLDDLREHFSKFGGIKCIYVKVEAAAGHSRGYAFVVFKTMVGLDNVSILFG